MKSNAGRNVSPTHPNTASESCISFLIVQDVCEGSRTCFPFYTRRYYMTVTSLSHGSLRRDKMRLPPVYGNNMSIWFADHLLTREAHMTHYHCVQPYEHVHVISTKIAILKASKATVYYYESMLP